MTSLVQKTVVITGGSSGLGLAAAVQFAALGACVVVAGRREEALVETVRLCAEVGGRASYVVTDVTDESQVRRLAGVAVERHGAIDVWVNNAGVTLFGLLEGTPFDEHRRVIETNLYGAMYGARAVIPLFRERRQGVLINVGSILSKIGQAYVPSYVISKFALRGLSETLRVELADHPDVHVCTLFPYTIDTPHFETGANHVGREARALQPIQSPESVAAAMVDLAQRPRRERHVPRYVVLGLALHEVMPRTVERLLLESLRKWYFGSRREAESAGSLYRPETADGHIHGTRRPKVSTPRFFAWAIAKLFQLPSQPKRSNEGPSDDSGRARVPPPAPQSVEHPSPVA